MTNNINTLWDILQENKISIPKIQRDYAQGRNDEECIEKRNKFFEYLYKKLKKGNTFTKLDFIYGALNNRKMEPLDGQQRLTTLFLLHVYALKLSDKYKNNEDYKKTLKNFEYETRPTSLRFCESLVDNNFSIPEYILPPYKKEIIEKIKQLGISENEVFSIGELIEKYNNDNIDKKQYKKEIKLVKEICEYIDENNLPNDKQTKYQLEPPMESLIKNQTWYYSDYDDDQTVAAMINSLEDLHKYFYPKFKENKDALWDKLTADIEVDGCICKGQIGFNYIPLEHYNLTDDLYIKMNARGKALTPFENFKAMLEDISTNNEDNLKNNFGKQIKIYDKDYIFRKRIDTDWTQFIWKYIKKKTVICNPNYLVDTALTRILSTCIRWHCNDEDIITKLNDKEKDNKLNNLIDYILYSQKHEAEDANTRADYEYAQKIFNSFCDVLKTYYELDCNDIDFELLPKSNLFDWKPNENENLVQNLILGTIDAKSKKIEYSQYAKYSEHVMFYAHTQYLIKNKDSIITNKKIDKDKYNDWMRIVRNIVLFPGSITITNEKQFQTWIRKPDDYIKAIELLKRLSKYSDDIITNLSNCSAKDIEYIYENIRKLNWLIKENLWEEYHIAKAITSSNNKIETIKIIEEIENNFIMHGSIRLGLKCLDINIENLLEDDIYKLYEWYKTKFNIYFPNNQEDLPRIFGRAMLTLEQIKNNENQIYSYEYNNYYQKCNLYDNTTDILYISNTQKTIYQNYLKFIKDILNKMSETGENSLAKACQKIIKNFNSDGKNLPLWQEKLIKQEIYEQKDEKGNYLYEAKIYFDNNQMVCLKKYNEVSLIPIDSIKNL